MNIGEINDLAGEFYIDRDIGAEDFTVSLDGKYICDISKNWAGNWCLYNLPPGRVSGNQYEKLLKVIEAFNEGNHESRSELVL